MRGRVLVGSSCLVLGVVFGVSPALHAAERIERATLIVGDLVRQERTLGDSAWCTQAKHVCSKITQAQSEDARRAARTLLRSQRSRNIDLGSAGSDDAEIQHRLIVFLAADGADHASEREGNLRELATAFGDMRQELGHPFKEHPAEVHNLMYDSKDAAKRAAAIKQIQADHRSNELLGRRRTLEAGRAELEFAFIQCLRRELRAQEREGALGRDLFKRARLTPEEQHTVRAR